MYHMYHKLHVSQTLDSPNTAFLVFMCSNYLPGHVYSSGTLAGEGRGGERGDGWGAEKWKNRGFSFRVFLKKLTSFCVSKVKSIGGMEGGLKKNFNGLVKPTLKVFLNLKLIRTLILFKLCACFLHFLMIPYAIPEYVAIRPATHNRQNAVITWKFKRKQSTSHLLCALK